MLDLRDGGQAYIGILIGRKTMHSLIDNQGWHAAREYVARLFGRQDIIDIMRLWEAFAGVSLAQLNNKKLAKDSSKDERNAQAALLYKQAKHFDFLAGLLNSYGNTIKDLENDLEACYTPTGVPNASLAYQLSEHFSSSAVADEKMLTPAPKVSSEEKQKIKEALSASEILSSISSPPLRKPSLTLADSASSSSLSATASSTSSAQSSSKT